MKPQMDWEALAALFTPLEAEWAMSAWFPSSAAQNARESRVDAIRHRLAMIGFDLAEKSWLPASDLITLITERDALWLELADAGEFPCLVRKDGAARYARKAAP